MALFRRGKGSDGKRVLRKDRTGRSPFTVGAIALVLIAALTYLAFTKHIPFTSKFQLNAVFTNANSLRPNSPVRIAGVNVGKVKSIARYANTNASLVTMSLDPNALPIHADATMKIRPRIFLEGNFFVDIEPGTPESPNVGDGATIPMTQTAAPVQFGDVLTALQTNDRQNLQEVLRGLGTALTRPPNAADNAQSDPATRGESAAKSLNRATTYGAPALRDASIVNEALLGQQPDDLSTVIRSLGTVTGALDRNERSLQDFVSNFNTTMHALASEKTSLRSTIRLLAPTLDVTNRTLTDLDRALPPTSNLALALIPGTRETPSTIDAAFPWIDQVRAALRPSELRGLVQQLSPTTRDLSRTVDATVSLLPQQDLVAKCFNRIIFPTGDVRIKDGPLSTGVENYKEFWYTMVGLSGEGQNFDGNGMYVRFQPGGSVGGVSSQSLGVGTSTLSGDTVFQGDPNRPLGTRPMYPGRRPPYRPDVPCYTNTPPDINGAREGPSDANAGGSSGSAGGTGGGGSVLPTPALPGVPALPAAPRSSRRGGGR